MPGPEIIDHAVTDAVVADTIVSDNERRRRRKASGKSAFPPPVDAAHCSNCRTALKGPVCHSCGQEADTFHRPIWSLVMEVLDGLFAFDGRFWRTIPPLIFRPGRVTREYLTGVRARYVQPFRLFIVASLAFFLVFSLDGDWNGLFGGDAEPDAQQLQEAERALAEAEAENPELAAQLGLLREQIEEAEAASAEVDANPQIAAIREQERRDAMELAMRQSLLPEDYPGLEREPGGTVRQELNGNASVTFEADGLGWLPYSARAFLANRIGHVIQEPDSWMRSVQVWTPRIIFALLPVYALLLALMHFWRRGIYFYDHLVVSLHFHAFIFFLMTALILAGPVIGAWGMLIFVLWSNFYLYRLHRRVYEHGRFMSVVRVLVLDLVYFFVLTFALLILLAVGLLFA